MNYKTVIFSILAVTGTGMLLNNGLGLINQASADDKLEYRQARELREQGKILPLQEILNKVSQEHPGQVIETELEKDSERYIYELEILDAEGRVVEVKVDAASGESLSIEMED